LRNALGESAEDLRYIETLAKRGYRFAGQLETFAAHLVDANPPAPLGAGGDSESTNGGELAGTRVSHYRILGKLGEGGMGIVYRAEDSRLGRQVALKFLPAPVSEIPPALLQRFEREARAASALNHPNICIIYGLEDAGGRPAIAMELIEGETLSARLRRGQLPIKEALQAGIQIAAALSEAHSKCVVHRDLKPSNIMLTKAGLKVLDFGLAKIEHPTAIADEISRPGLVLGTAHYLSPEQAQGRDIDTRTDIFSFGVVLFEMLAGERPFEGQSAAGVIAAILERDPPSLGDSVPAVLEHVVRRCLAKNPDDRWQSARDLQAELEWILKSDHPPVAAIPQERPLPISMAWRFLRPDRAHLQGGARRPRCLAGGPGFALLCGVALWAPWRSAVRPVEPLSTPVDLDLGPDVSFGSPIGPAVILSPDGSRMVFVSQGADGVPRLFTRRLDQSQVVQLPGTEGAFAQFFSPDGQWVGFFAQGKLKKMRVEGGAPVSLCDAAAPRGASWGDDGSILADLGARGLVLLSSEGERPRLITHVDMAKVTTHRWPYILPGSKAALFVSGNLFEHFDEADIEAVTFKDHHIKTVLPHAGSYPRYLPSGHLMYITQGTAFAAPFDLDRLEVTGPPVRLWEVGANPNFGFGQFDFSRNGILAYRTGGAEALNTIQWLDAGGKTESLGLAPANYMSANLSPDGGRVAYTLSQGASQEIWTYDLTNAIKTRVTTGQYAYPIWSPDGRFLIFHTLGGLAWARADGSGRPQPLTRSKGMQWPFSFTPDALRLMYAEQTPEAGEIRTVAVDGQSGQLQAGESQSFLKVIGPFPTFSPDGHWLAYTGFVNGEPEVYVRAFPDNGQQVPISNGGGVWPMWSSNGHELFYRTEGQRIMVANYQVKGNSFVPDKPRVWSSRPLANTGIRTINFAVAPDGKRVLAVMPVQEPREAQSHVTLVMNFFDEVRRRIGGK
jgi:serine/threonine-protein kinase